LTGKGQDKGPHQFLLGGSPRIPLRHEQISTTIRRSKRTANQSCAAEIWQSVSPTHNIAVRLFPTAIEEVSPVCRRNSTHTQRRQTASPKPESATRTFAPCYSVQTTRTQLAGQGSKAQTARNFQLWVTLFTICLLIVLRQDIDSRRDSTLVRRNQCERKSGAGVSLKYRHSAAPMLALAVRLSTKPAHQSGPA